MKSTRIQEFVIFVGCFIEKLKYVYHLCLLVMKGAQVITDTAMSDACGYIETYEYIVFFFLNLAGRQ